MLKIAHDPAEQAACEVLQWWAGQGAARVYRRQGAHILMERAVGSPSLLHMALDGEDRKATEIICGVAARLHEPHPHPRPPLIPLRAWFASLERASQSQEELYARCWRIAEALLSEQQEITVLHGDIHQQNILEFGEAGWKAIDPRGLVGERAYDYANIFANPDLADVASVERLQTELPFVAELLAVESKRLLCWVIAHAGLSAAWFAEDGFPIEAERQLRFAALALSQVDR